jgi:hypothetical protein
MRDHGSMNVSTAVNSADQELLADVELRLLAEEDELRGRLHVNRRRLAVIRATLDRIAQQRAVSEVDRLLGLE